MLNGPQVFDPEFEDPPLSILASYPVIFDPLFTDQLHRWLVFWGGRGKGATWSFARAAISRAISRKTRFLCAREYQSSIADSVMAVIEGQAQKLKVQLPDGDILRATDYLKIQKTAIECPRTGSDFLFKGVRQNVNSVKSTEGVDVLWLEEAEKVSNNSWKVLIPTIRKKGSQIWVNFNPDLETDPTYVRLVKNKPPNSLIRHVTFKDNPFFNKTELEAERAYLETSDPDAYAHVWLGECVKNSHAAVLHGKWRIANAEEMAMMESPPADIDGPYYGGDFGFAADPTAGSRMFIRGTTLYITHEMYKARLENDHMAKAFIDALPGVEKYTLMGDSARPDTISYLQRHGLPRMQGAEKGPGSIEDGITFLRAFSQIVIHERCKNTVYEFRTYSHKVDKLSGNIQPDIVDANNHIIDAIRYALVKLIMTSKKTDGIIRWMQRQGEQRRAEAAAAKALAEKEGVTNA